MNYFTKLFLLLFLITSPISAFDNEIRIKAKVIEGISIGILNLSEGRDNIYLSTNSKLGAKITVKELSKDDKNRIKNILNNGLKFKLPMSYELFNNSSFLGTSPLPYGDIILGIDVSVH